MTNEEYEEIQWLLSACHLMPEQVEEDDEVDSE